MIVRRTKPWKSYAGWHTIRLPIQQRTFYTFCDATGSHESRNPESPKQALTERQDPQAAADLAQVFIRSRLGELPKIDLFEQALRGLIADDLSIQRAIQEGMLPLWANLPITTHEPMEQYWTSARSITTHASMAGHPSKELQNELAPLIHSALEEHGATWVQSFSTQGGSAWSPLAQRPYCPVLVVRQRPRGGQRRGQIALGLSRLAQIGSRQCPSLNATPQNAAWKEAREDPGGRIPACPNPLLGPAWTARHTTWSPPA